MKETNISVLHLITRLIVGGAQENTIDTAANLDQDLFKTEIISGLQTGSEGSLVEDVRIKGIPLTLIPELVREVSPRNDFRALRKLHSTMRSCNPAIVHTHSSKAGILGRLAARMAGVPVIVHTIHGWGFHDFMPLPQRYFYILLERLLARFTHALIAVSNQDIQVGLRNNIGSEDQYHLIRSAILTKKISPDQIDPKISRTEFGIPQDAIVIGTIGRLSPQKNPKDWIRIAGLIHRSFPDVFFLVVGDGPLRSQVEQEVRKMDVAEKIIIAGIQRDVSRYLSAMDIFMMTSLWEGLPRTILHALNMNIPVVAYNVGGVPEVVIQGETGLLSQPGNIDEMTKHIENLINDPQLRARLGKNGADLIQDEFDLNKMIREITELYEMLLLCATKKNRSIF